MSRSREKIKELEVMVADVIQEAPNTATLVCFRAAPASSPASPVAGSYAGFRRLLPHGINSKPYFNFE